MQTLIRQVCEQVIDYLIKAERLDEASQVLAKMTRTLLLERVKATISCGTRRVT